MKVHVIFIAFFVLVACANPKSQVSKVSMEFSSTCLAKINFQTVDVSDLLKHPQAYDNKYIQIEGFYSHGFERSSVSLNKNEAPKKSIWIGIDNVRCPLISYTDSTIFLNYQERMRINNLQIKVRGKFDYADKGHFDQFAGALDSINSIVVYETRE